LSIGQYTLHYPYDKYHLKLQPFGLVNRHETDPILIMSGFVLEGVGEFQQGWNVLIFCGYEMQLVNVGDAAVVG
jgi:hypothetical protein